MNGDKRGFLVLLFFLFIIGAVFAVIIFDSKDNKKEDDIDVILNSNVPNVSDSKEVVIVTSNKKSNSNSSKNSNKESNKNSSKNSSKTSNKPTSNSNKKEIPVAYFTAKLSNNKIYVGGQAKLTVDIKPDNATNKSVKFYSSDSTIARVSDKGIITGITPGVCTITIDVYDCGTAEVDIQVLKLPVSNSNKSNSNSNSNNPVINPPIIPSNSNSNPTSNTPTVIHVSSVSISPTSVTLQKGNSTKLSYTVYPSNANDKRVTWSSSNTSVATVSNGTVTAKGAGTATIYVTSVDGNKKAASSITVTVPKNGWVTENGKKYYYKDNVKLKDQFIDYIYLNGDGVAQDKIGSFDITLHGTTAWVARYSAGEPFLYLKSSASSSSSTKATLQPGTKVTIIGAESNGYLPVRVNSNGNTGWIWANSTFVNLPELMPNIKYKITNASSSIFQVSDGKALGSEKRYDISGVTGVNLYASATGKNYGFGPYDSSKLHRNEYYAPLLYPTAKKLQNALNSARNAGYNFVIYDTYRPNGVEVYVKNKYMAQYQNWSSVQKDRNGNWWGWTWFMTSDGKSRHCQGIAIDMSLTDSRGNELAMQSRIHMLDTSGVRNFNNANANTLSGFMTGAGFNTLKSEWWHFQDDNFKNRLYEDFTLN